MPTRPAEWQPQASVYTAWPRLEDAWGPDLGPARGELAALAREIAAPRGRGAVAPEVLVLVGDPAARRSAEAAFDGEPGVTLLDAPYGDIWLRDIAPLFLGTDGDRAIAFGFNGWGGKYDLPGDQETAEAVAEHARVPWRRLDLVAEGGALEVDGEGTLLTTRSCLLGPTRNPGRTADEITGILRSGLGVDRVVWLDGSLANDHTDGHIDTLARFAAPGRVLHMRATDPGDPNRETLEGIARQLGDVRDAQGRRLELIPIPSPGAVPGGEDGSLLPASYLNFLVTNQRVLVPTYGVAADDAAIGAIAEALPTHEVIGLSARALLSGGGAFHCITQERPGDPGWPSLPASPETERHDHPRAL